MREVRIHITCDWCDKEIDEEVTRKVSVTFGTKEYEGDACLACVEPLTREMRLVTKKRARRKRATGDIIT